MKLVAENLQQETTRKKLSNINPQEKGSKKLWQQIRDTIKEAANDIQEIPNCWLTAETLNVIEERNLEKNRR